MVKVATFDEKMLKGNKNVLVTDWRGGWLVLAAPSTAMADRTPTRELSVKTAMQTP